MYEYLLTIIRDMQQLTKTMSSAVKPDTNEAFEIIAGIKERLGSGKYDTIATQQLRETQARIQDELTQPRRNEAALRAQMRTQHAKWNEVYATVSAANRAKMGVESLLYSNNLDNVSLHKPIPKILAANKPYLAFMHQVIFTNRKVISKEAIRKMPVTYHAVALGSGYRFDEQLIIALQPSTSVERSNKAVKETVAGINKAYNRKYIPSLSDVNGGPSFFSIPGSKLIYVWLVPQNIAHEITLDLRSITLPDGDIDSVQKTATPDVDKLKFMRTRLEGLIATDVELKKLHQEKSRQELLSRSVVKVNIAIEDRKRIIRETLKQEMT